VALIYVDYTKRFDLDGYQDIKKYVQLQKEGIEEEEIY